MNPRQVATMSDVDSLREEVIVNLDNGLHLVPCSKIAQIANNFACEVRILKDDCVVDAKGVFDLMTLRAEQGTHLIIEATGTGAAEAMEKLLDQFHNDFYVDRSH